MDGVSEDLSSGQVEGSGKVDVLGTDNTKKGVRSRVSQKLQNFLKRHKTIATVATAGKLVGQVGFSLSDDAARIYSEVTPEQTNTIHQIEVVMPTPPVKPKEFELSANHQTVAQGGNPPDKSSNI